MPVLWRAESGTQASAGSARREASIRLPALPLTEAHPYALRAAEAIEAAAEQGMFLEMHDVLYEHQNALTDEGLIEYAADIGLDTEQFTRELDAGVTRNASRKTSRAGAQRRRRNANDIHQRPPIRQPPRIRRTARGRRSARRSRTRR